MKQSTAIIIGAGYGGMALANLLGKAGYQVTVVEKNSTPGGRIQAVKQDGYTFDLGPSWYLMPEIFEQYYNLFDRSSSQQLDLQRFTPGYQVFYQDGQAIRIEGDIEHDKRTFEAIEPGSGAALVDYLEKSSRVYELSVKYFLYSNFRRVRDLINVEVIKNIPAMIGLVIQPLHKYVASKFKNSRLQQILEYHMVFLGSSPFQAPAVYTLMSHLDFKSGIFYPRRGMLSLVEDMQALGDGYDVDYRYDSPVQRIIVENGQAVGVELMGGENLTADIVVSNADLHHTETKLLPPDLQTYPESYWQKRQPGPGGLLISLGINKPLPGLLHHNLYFVDQWRQNFRDIYEDKKIPEHASVYVCNPSKTDPGLAPTGKENLFILVPIPAGVELNDQQSETLADRIIDRFSEVCGEADLADHIESKLIFGPSEFESKFNAWHSNAFGGESHLLSQSILFRTRNKSRKVKNLYYVGAGTLPGIGLPMCLIGAQMTYKRIVGDPSAGPLEMGDF